MDRNTINKLNLHFMKSLSNRLKDADAEGLINEFSSSVSDNRFVIFSTPAGYYANAGRGPGKMPSTKQIEPWVRRKGIPVKKTYAIAKSIGDNGTKGLHFMDDFDKEMKEMVVILTEQFKKDIINLI